MFAVQNLARAAPKIANSAVQQVRNNHIVSKPRVRITFAEKVIHGLVLSFVPLALPMWWATHFNEWTAKMNEE